MKRKPLLISILAILILGGWYLYHHNLTTESGILRTTGTVEGTEVNITSKVAGRLATLLPREGDTVAAQATLLTLDNDDLSAQIRSAQAGVAKAEAEARVAGAAIANLKAAVETSAAEILAAQAELAKNQVQVVDAERHLARFQKLHEQGVVAKESLESAETTRDTAVAAVQAATARVAATQAGRHSAEAQLRMAESQLGLARASVSQAQADQAYRQSKLAETTVASPIHGTVVYRALEVGETVAPGTTILTLVDLEHLTVRIDLDESRLGRIKPGDPARISLDARPDQSFPARVATIGRYGDFATQRDVAAGRQDLRTFRVTLALDPGTTGLNPGMTVQVEIPTPQRMR